MNYDKTGLVSASGDGFSYIYTFDQKNFLKIIKNEEIEQMSYPELANGIGDGTYNDEIEIFDKNEEADILDHNIYSI